MRTLRANCPWDQAQTHASLMPHLVEESYEVLDAIAAAGGPGADDDAFTHLEEELGDLLFQIVFHACLAEEEGHFNLADVARGVHDKLVHRHPHVFGEVAADTAAQVVTNWEAIKKAEKGRTSVTEGIPSQLPALMLATKLQRKASSVGLDSEETGELTAVVLAEVAHLAAGTGVADADAPLSADAEAQERLVGQLLFDVADLARRLGVDAEQALRTRALQLRAAIVAAESAGVPEAQAGAD